MAKPPLFLLKASGNRRWYAYSDNERDEKIAELIEERKASGCDDKSRRFTEQTSRTGMIFSATKVLERWTLEQLWETTMNPENRVLVQVKVEDVERADAIFTKLMGDEVPLRKSFIQSRAKNADLEELDV